MPIVCSLPFLLLFFFCSLLQAILQEEKRVIHALRRGVEKQDYGKVKGLLAQAEEMGLSGEEVKQAQAMRLRIEVGRVWGFISPWFGCCLFLGWWCYGRNSREEKKTGVLYFPHTHTRAREFSGRAGAVLVFGTLLTTFLLCRVESFSRFSSTEQHARPTPSALSFLALLDRLVLLTPHSSVVPWLPLFLSSLALLCARPHTLHAMT